jgi:hypothetical protein
MNTITKSLLVGLIIGVMGNSMVWAQATAEASGTVRDQTGAVLPGVEVTATQTDTGISRTAITNETGSYVLPNLPTGPYRLEAVLPGFRTYVQTGIVLQVGGSPVINPILEVGQVTESVEVQANAALIETRNVSVGQIMENERILELPLNGRNVQELITLAGGAVQTGTTPQQSLQGIPVISVAGAFQSATSYRLDGAIHIINYDNNSLPLPFPDALQEFQVETGVRSARSGRNAGAEVNSVTKSGTNEFHGNAFWFVRNDLLNARNYFATAGSSLKRNQFGGTIGGPIAQNRLFFFVGYQGTTIRQDPSDVREFVPSSAMLAGDFTAFASAACRTTPITLSAPFVNNRIDPARFSRAALNLAARLPKTDNPCGEITYGRKQKTNTHQIVSRVDYQLNAKQSLFGRVMFDDYQEPHPYTFDESNILLSSSRGYDNWVSAYAAGHTYLFSPTTINELRLSASRWEAVRSKALLPFALPDLGVNIFSYEPDQPRVSVTGGFSLGTNNGPNIGNSFELSDEISLVRGDHQLAFGTNIGYGMSFLRSNVRTSGNFSFSGRATGTGLSDFLMGNVTELQQTPPTDAIVTQWFYGLYGGDTWRTTPRVTLTYGLRWEPYIPQVRRDGKLSNFDEARYAAGKRSTVYANAPAGFIYPGDPDFPRATKRDDGTYLAAGQDPNWGNLSPRVGLAWDVFGDGRTSARAGFSIAYEQLTGGLFAGFISPPWDNRVIMSSPPGGFDDPWRGFPGGNPFPTSPQVRSDAFFVDRGSYYSLPTKNPTTYRNSWNLSIQRELRPDLAVEATYIGSQVANMWYNKPLNWGLYVPGVGDANGNCFYNGRVTPFRVQAGRDCSTTANLDERRRLNVLYPNVGGATLSYLDEYGTGGTQSYHGLVVSIQRRSANGVNISGNYTLSHCWGDTNSSQSGHGGNPDQTHIDPYNRDFDRGNCDYYRRYIFNMTAVLQTPQFANATVRTLAGNWRLSLIYRKQSGGWLTATMGRSFDRALSGIADQRPNQVLGNVFLDKSGKPDSQYLNPAAFQLPPVGGIGNMGPRNIQEPGTWSFDVGLTRRFQVRENQNIEFRAEAYNLTNSFRPTGIIADVRNQQFGKIRDSLAPRVMQFALKYGF